MVAPVLLMLMATGVAPGAVYVLGNGPGDGSVSVGVDGFGSFGSAVGGNSSNAIYDPVGGIPWASGTTYESGVAIRMGASGPRTFLTSGDIGNSGRLTNPAVIGSSTTGSSAFSHGGLEFSLTQTLSPLFDGGVQSGSVLSQTYVITNPSTASADFELVRYVDGDLLFNGSFADGGGRLATGSSEILFQIDSATGSSTASTFVGITAEGGIIPTTGRYEIDGYSALCARIIAGMPLADSVTGDGFDPDEFIDAGSGYDVTLALNNAFSLDPGASTTYRTSIIFGTGEPGRVTGTTVPEAGEMLVPFAAVMVALLVVGGWIRRPGRTSTVGGCAGDGARPASAH